MFYIEIIEIILSLKIDTLYLMIHKGEEEKTTG